MKKLVQNILQRLLGFDRYLLWFSWFKIKTLRRDRKEGDFIHFLSMLGPQDTVLDIGANIGIMTVHLARQCAQGTVHAIEPIPENFHALGRIVKRFQLSNVKLHQFALGEKKGELEMVMPEVSNVKMQGLSHVVHDSITEFNEGSRYKVPVHKLDDLDELTKGVRGIKIDVENFEYFVFKGGAKMLQRERPIVYCELWANENRELCFKLFRELGYEIKVLESGALVSFDPEQHHNQNFFFVPQPNN